MLPILKLIFVAIVMMVFVVGAMSVRILFKRDGHFSGGSCQSSPELRRRGIVNCACSADEVDTCSTEEAKA